MSTRKSRNDGWTVVAIVLVGALLVSSPGRSADGILVERDVAVPMSDGTILRAHVFRPAAEGMYPVLVMRTPYGKPAKVDEDLVRAGFIVVTQDARGRYASDGRYESFVRSETHDGSDGRDTVEWAARLAGSNGKVGLFGTSYPAFLAWRAAGQQPPSLAAMAAFSIPASYLDLEGPGTIRPGRRLKWWYGTISPDLRRKSGGVLPHVNSEAVAKWDAGEGKRLLHFLPWQQLPDEIFGTEAPFVKGWLREPWRDPWQLYRDAVHANVPNLNLCGWYDHCNGSIDLHPVTSAPGKSFDNRQYSQLIVGPWSHSALGKRRQGEVDFGPEAEVDLTALQVEWFRHWMKSEQDEVKQRAPVRLFVMGANTWRDFSEWPPKLAAPRSWYLDSDGAANTPLGNGRLVADPPTRGHRDHYRYDPHEPVPTLWTPALFTIPADQKPLAGRTDILVYQTPPLESFVETIGYPEVVLHVTSSCPDTDFFARLIDVSPDSKAIDVTMGMVRARYRGPWAVPPGDGDSAAVHEAWLKPGEVTELKIRLRPTAHRFLAGHRIRLDVTSSDFPNYDRHHNTAADLNDDAELVVAHQTIHHDSTRPSRLCLPVMTGKLTGESSTPGSAARSLRVTTDFEGGSARVLAIDPSERRVRIMPGGDSERGWPCWWFLRVDGVAAGERLALEVLGSDRSARNNGLDTGKPLSANWAMPARATFSTDGKSWHHTAPGVRKGDNIRYEVIGTGDPLSVAWGPPFTPRDTDEMIASATKSLPTAQSFELARSRRGLPVRGLHFPPAGVEGAPAIWVQARQHAWESGASWVARGFTEWLTSDDEDAQWLRSRAEVFVVPIMDVDNVITGNGGKEAAPRDHNRDWDREPFYPEVAAAQRHLQAIGEADRLELFLDLHNPSAGDARPFFFVGPPEMLSESARERREYFLARARMRISGPLPLEDRPRITGPSYHPLWKQISGLWVNTYGSPHTVAVCLETAWNTPHSTTAGYLAVGRQLGMASTDLVRHRLAGGK